jgi:hypothetical protein
VFAGHHSDIVPKTLKHLASDVYLLTKQHVLFYRARNPNVIETAFFPVVATIFLPQFGSRNPVSAIFKAIFAAIAVHPTATPLSSAFP